MNHGLLVILKTAFIDYAAMKPAVGHMPINMLS